MSGNSLSLGGLERLSRERGVDTRPTLLRVVTDLFASAPHRTQADIDRYADLATPLLAQADLATRIAVARRLAPLPEAPASIIERLLTDDVEVACEVIRHCPALDTERLFAIAINGGLAEALALAERTDIDRGLARVLSRNAERQVVVMLASNTDISFDAATLSNLVARGRTDAELAGVLLARSDVPARACAALYMRAAPLERQRIRMALGENSFPGAQGIDARAAGMVATAARNGPRQSLVHALAFAFRQPQEEIATLFTDPMGEVLALALIACGVSREDMVSALLVFAPEAVRSSVDLIFNAAGLHDETPRAVAYAIANAAMESAAEIHGAYVPHLDPAGGVKRPQAAAQPGAAHAEHRLSGRRGGPV